MSSTNPSPTCSIVGFGLAGATLAWQFYLENRLFRVFDSGTNHCTRIAAGLANPIVFRRLTKSWNADILMPHAEQFYSRIEEILGLELLSRKNIYTVFTSVEGENNWSAREGDERFQKFISSTDIQSIENVQMPYGIGRVRTFGNLDTNLFLDATKEFLVKQGIVFHTREFDYSEVPTESEEPFIFCEGVGMLRNPFFCRLPLKPTHGEVLTIETDELDFDDVLNRNMFVLPIGDHRYKIGSTYRWDLDEPVTTEPGKAEILEKFENFIDCRYKIIRHEAGLRPAVAGRRPLIGTHPAYTHLHVFNGLGTKGIMIAPYYAAQLSAFLFEGGTLDPEVDVRRFSTLLV